MESKKNFTDFEFRIYDPQTGQKAGIYYVVEATHKQSGVSITINSLGARKNNQHFQREAAIDMINYFLRNEKINNRN
jgi:hypothetical protein